MAKITQIVSQATPQYEPANLNQFGRDINNIIQTLNSTYPQDIKEETESVSYFLKD